MSRWDFVAFIGQAIFSAAIYSYYAIPAMACCVVGIVSPTLGDKLLTWLWADKGDGDES